MKASALVTLAIVAALAITACNYAKPMIYINLANRSGEAMKNVEVHYSTGSFGLPELLSGQTHRRMTPAGKPCTLRIEFEGAAGGRYSGTFMLGDKCPDEVEMDVDTGMKISAKPLGR